MSENLRVRTARLLQGIRQDGQPPAVQRTRRQVPLVVGGLGETDHGGGVPGQDGRVAGDGTEGVAEDVTQKGTLS
jgi:hypothetical protein